MGFYNNKLESIYSNQIDPNKIYSIIDDYLNNILIDNKLKTFFISLFPEIENRDIVSNLCQSSLYIEKKKARFSIMYGTPLSELVEKDRSIDEINIYYNSIYKNKKYIIKMTIRHNNLYKVNSRFDKLQTVHLYNIYCSDWHKKDFYNLCNFKYFNLIKENFNDIIKESKYPLKPLYCGLINFEFLGVDFSRLECTMKESKVDFYLNFKINSYTINKLIDIINI